MVTALLGLGSNQGNRERNLSDALTRIDALPDVLLRRASKFYTSNPLGGPAGQPEFLNCAAVVQTKTPPLQLLDELKGIEVRSGRGPAERWAARPLDIDLLLFDDQVMETQMLTLPHPRMSFRRFVLEPAVEIAPRMLHPVIGWSLERLLLHLTSASDLLAIVSPSENYRRHFSDLVIQQFRAQTCSDPQFATAEQLWPAKLAAWLKLEPMPNRTTSQARSRPTLSYAAAAFPKLTILLDGDSSQPNVSKSQWSATVRRPGRGPTLRLQATDAANFQDEILAAVEAVWPELGRGNRIRLQ